MVRPVSSTTTQRSASPSKQMQAAAPCSRTACCTSARFASTSGLGSWRKVPSVVKFSGTISRPRTSAKTLGTITPAMPLEASTATRTERRPSTSSGSRNRSTCRR